MSRRGRRARNHDGWALAGVGFVVLVLNIVFWCVLAACLLWIAREFGVFS